MDMKLEVVVIPVADVDRSRRFYQGLGWRLDADIAPAADYRVVQLTPPGSPTSIIFGTKLTTQAPGTAEGLQLIVNDIEAAREELSRMGAPVSEVFHDANGVFHRAGLANRVAGPDPDRKSYGSWVSFADPDWPDWYAQYMVDEQAGAPGVAGAGESA